MGHTVQSLSGTRLTEDMASLDPTRREKKTDGQSAKAAFLEFIEIGDDDVRVRQVLRSWMADEPSRWAAPK